MKHCHVTVNCQKQQNGGRKKHFIFTPFAIFHSAFTILYDLCLALNLANNFIIRCTSSHAHTHKGLINTDTYTHITHKNTFTRSRLIHTYDSHATHKYIFTHPRLTELTSIIHSPARFRISQESQTRTSRIQTLTFTCTHTKTLSYQNI